MEIGEKYSAQFKEIMINLLISHEDNPGLTLQLITELESTFGYLSNEFRMATLILLLNTLEYTSKIRKMGEKAKEARVCGKRILKGDICWSCYTCEAEHNSCLCDKCYIPATHVGHKTFYSISDGGFCDCGDSSYIKSTSFCPRHLPQNIPLDTSISLPKYIEEGADLLLDYIRFQLYTEIILCGVAFSTPELDKLTNLLLILNDLSNFSPLFRSKIKDILLSKAPDSRILTKHLCVDQLLEASKLKYDFDLDIPEHPCTCTVLDNIMKYLTFTGKNSKIVIFIGELAKQDADFGYIVFTSFFANYSYFAEYSHIRIFESSETIEMVMSSCRSISSKNPSLMPLVSTKNIRDQYINILHKKCIQYLSEIPNESSIFRICNIITDFINNIEDHNFVADYLLINTDFYEKFVSICEILQLADHKSRVIGASIEQQHLDGYVTLISLLDLFALNLVNITLSDSTLIVKISGIFKQELITNIHKFENIEGKYFLCTPLNWAFTLFLSKLIEKWWVRENSLEIKDLKKYLMHILQYEDEIVFNEMLDKIGRIALQHINFILEIMCGVWSGNGLEISEKLVKIYFNDTHYSIPSSGGKMSLSVCGWDLDLGLIQIIYSLVPSLTLIEWVFHTDEDIEEAKLAKLREARMYYMAVFLSNDMAIPKLALVKRVSWSVTYSQNEQKLLNFCVKKLALRQIIMKKDIEKMKAFNMTKLKEGLNNHFSHADEAESILREMCEPTITPSGKQGSRIAKGGLEYFHIFNISQLQDFFDSEMIFREYLKYSKIDNLDLLQNGKEEVEISFIIASLVENQLLNGFLETMIKEFNIILGNKIGLKLFTLKIIYSLTDSLYQNSNKFDISLDHDIELLFVNNLSQFKQNNKGYSISCDNLLKMLAEIFPQWCQDESVQKMQELKIPEEIPEEHKFKISSIKEKQAQILASFAEKRRLFSEKQAEGRKEGLIDEESKYLENIENIPLGHADILENNTTNTSICCHCRSELNLDSFKSFHQNPFGKCVNISINTSQVLKQRTDYAEGTNYLKTKNPCITYPPFLPTQNSVLEENKSMGTNHYGVATTNSCGHYIHYECLNQYKENSPYAIQGTFLCPACKYYSHAIAPQFILTGQKVGDMGYLCIEEYLKCLSNKNSNNIIQFEDNIEIQNEIILRNSMHSLYSELCISEFISVEKYIKSEKLEILQMLFKSIIQYELIISTGKQRQHNHQAIDKLILERIIPHENRVISYNIYMLQAIYIMQEFIIFKCNITEKTENSQLIIQNIIKECPNLRNNLEESIKFLVEQILLSYIFSEGKKYLVDQINLICPESIELNYDKIEGRILKHLEKYIYLRIIVECWNRERISNFIEYLGSKKSIEERVIYLCDELNIISVIRRGKTPSTHHEELVNYINEHIMRKETKSNLIRYLAEISSPTERNSREIQHLVELQNPHSPYKTKFLINLNHTYDEVILENARRTCEHCKRERCNRCLCLLCGALLCCKSKCCHFTSPNTGLTIGEVTYHALSAEYSIGIFLLLHSGSLIIMTPEESAVFSAPYRNEFNESIMDYFESHRFTKSTELRKYRYVPEELREWEEALIFGKVVVNVFYQIMKTNKHIEGNML